MKRILILLCSFCLAVTLTSCFETTTKKSSKSKQQSYQTRDGQKNVQTGSYSRSGKKSTPVFNLFNKKSFKNFGSKFRFNINELINDNFAAIIVASAVLLIGGFVFYQNRRSAKKGYR